ncbi:TetR/AcrR family transcriptional regulator [Streptomyces sp. NPDC047023]|uniref:TetR/AcrR family transcriptional regulator n=1 Tax=Streptomyces sp. NPDC047023 TaxID=3155139 RepID=UPI00340CE4EE
MAEPGLKARKVNRRVEQTRARVLAVARELLPVVGPLGLTYSVLAQQAQVTRQTLYRHWPQRDSLLMDLVLTGSSEGSGDAGADPGSVAGEFLRDLWRSMEKEGTGSALMTLAAQAAQDHYSAQVLERVVEERRAALNVLLEPFAVTVSAEEFALLLGPVLFQLFLSRQALADRVVDLAVSRWLDGVARRA